MLLGAWKVRVGPTIEATWTFERGGVVRSTQGAAKGRWSVDEKNREVLINWDGGAWSTLALPLNEKRSVGQASQNPSWRVLATKLPR